MAAGIKILVLQVYFHKYYWNIMYVCQLEDFKMKIVDIYIYIQQAPGEFSVFQCFYGEMMLVR